MTPRLRASDARGMRLEFARVEKCLAFRLQSPVSRHADRREDTMTKVPRARKQGVAKSQTGSDTAILALEELRHWRKYCGCACACACERARCVRGPGSAPELLRMTPAPKSIHRSLPPSPFSSACLSCPCFHLRLLLDLPARLPTLPFRVLSLSHFSCRPPARLLQSRSKIELTLFP